MSSGLHFVHFVPNPDEAGSQSFDVVMFMFCPYLFIPLYPVNNVCLYRVLFSWLLVLIVLVYTLPFIFSVRLGQLDGDIFLKSELEIPCWGSTHLIILSVAIPMLLFYSMGIPIVSAILLCKNKNAVQTILHSAQRLQHDTSTQKPPVQSPEQVQVRSRYGFLFLGFSEKFFFWESVVLFEKSILLFSSGACVCVCVCVDRLVNVCSA